VPESVHLSFGTMDPQINEGRGRGGSGRGYREGGGRRGRGGCGEGGGR